MKILYSVFVNKYRKVKREPALVPLDEHFERVFAGEGRDTDWTLLSNLSYGEKTSEVSKALGELPETFRSTMWLVDVEELSYEEAAEVLGCPLGTVRSRLARARKMLFVALQEYGERSGYTKPR